MVVAGSLAVVGGGGGVSSELRLSELQSVNRTSVSEFS